MANFDERVKAAWEAWGQSIGYSKGGVATALRAADAAEPEIGAVRRWLAGEAVDAATLPERLREVLSERDEEALRAAELCRKHVNERPPCSGDEDGCWMCSYEGAVASMDGFIDSTVRAEQERDEARERVAELVTEFDTERSERRAVERQRDEARAEVERLKRELDEERAWMREEKRHNIRMRAALDEIAVCLGRDGDDLKAIVEDVRRCSDGVVAADEKIERLTQERDALAAKVREHERCVGDCGRPCGLLPDHRFDCDCAESDCLDVRDAHYAAESAEALADAAAKGEAPVPWEDVKKRVGVSDPARLFSLDIGCDNGQDGDGDVFVAVVRRSDAVCVGEWRGEALLNALLSDIDPEDVARFAGAPTASPPPLDVEFTPERVPTPEEAEVLRAVDDDEPWAMKSPEAGECAKAGWIGNGHDGPGLTSSGHAALARFEAQEGREYTPPTGAPDDGGDVIDWKARALAAEAEDEARAQEVDQLRARIVELETEVARLRAALERETAPRMWVGRMAGVEPCTRCGAKWVD